LEELTLMGDVSSGTSTSRTVRRSDENRDRRQNSMLVESSIYEAIDDRR